MLIAAYFLLVGLILLLGILLAWSPGKPEPFRDENGRPVAGAVSEKVRLEVNGLPQGMIIKSKDATRPVLLYLHGGMPDYFLNRKYPTGLEELFTMVWWEQRGSGLSYQPGIPPERLTVEQLILDTLEISSTLRQRFGKEKIYLMGHSGGTFLGIQAAARAPELYHAYLGVAQMANQHQSEKLAYESMLRQFQADGNRRMVRKLESAPVSMAAPPPKEYMSVRDAAMHSLGIGTTHDMKSILTGILLPSFQCREYTLGEKIGLWRGKISSSKILWDQMIKVDLANVVTRLDLPVYFMHGIYDYTCCYPVTRSYFEKLTAPLKGFYTFQHSAHSPFFEEPEKMRAILQEDVLTGTNCLADPM